ncbi:ABC transporter permease [Sesbania bispinosa]|nr:ABC transporter permease [Sesbania bispinosa]
MQPSSSPPPTPTSHIGNGIDKGGGEPPKGDRGDWRLGLRTFDFWWREASLAAMEAE